MSARNPRMFSLVSLVLFSGLVMAYLWAGKFAYYHRLLLLVTYVSGTVIVLANHLYHRDGAARLGLRFDNLARATRLWGTVTAVLALVVVAFGAWIGEVRLDRWSDVYTYAVWAGLQQYLLQNFLRPRSEEALGGRRDGGAVVAALLFALFHLPNIPLMAVALAGGLLWCLLFARVPSFPWAWLSQAVLSLCLMVFLKYGHLDQLQVGKAGYRYSYYGGGVTVAGGYDAKRRPFVATLPGPDKGVPSLVRVFDLEGRLQSEWTAFEQFDFSGHLAVGDLGFEDGDEVVVAPGPGPGNPPLVRIFTPDGRALAEIDPPLPGSGYGAWVSVGCATLLVTPGPAPGAGGTVLRLSARGDVLARHTFDLGLENSLRAVALCGQPNRPEAGELLLWASPIAVNPSTVFVYDPVTRQMSSFDLLKTTFGLNAVPLWLGPGQRGIAMTPGPLEGYPPLVFISDLSGKTTSQFGGSQDRKSHGSNIAAVDADGDGRDEIILGEGIGRGRPTTIRLFTQDARLIRQWEAY
jgi:hypothetical protein